MKRTVPKVLVALVLACAVGATWTLTSAAAEPNPYGRESYSATVTLDSGGGYRVKEIHQQELVRKYELGFGAAIPAGVRLPDSPGQELPGILRPGIEDLKVSVDGAGQQIRPDTKGFALRLKTARQQRPAGPHTAVFEYRRTAATDPASMTTYVQVLAAARIVLDGPGIIEIRCVTYPPETIACGNRTAEGWLIDYLAVKDATGEGFRGPVVLAVRRDPGLVSAGQPVIQQN